MTLGLLLLTTHWTFPKMVFECEMAKYISNNTLLPQYNAMFRVQVALQHYK